MRKSSPARSDERGVVSRLTLAPQQRPAVVLHLGMGKTGTSTIQATFHRSRQRLAQQGILYPKSPGTRRHIRLGLAMQPDDGVPRRSVGWRRQVVDTPGELRPLFEEALFEELGQAAPRHVLFSDEALLTSTDEGIANLRELCDRFAASVRVVAYLRRQDDHLCSRYQQVVKREGEVRTLGERARSDLSPTYDYHDRLEAWRELMRPDEMVVRTFERSRFAGGSLLADFVEATGLDVRVEDLAEIPSKNESLDAESVEFLRLVNLHRAERGELPDPKLNNTMLRTLDQASQGPTLTLPDAELDRFMEQWERSNAAVAREFAGRAGDQLFESGRKTRDTTTEQHLDPARLDHFFALLDLPPDLHEPLRRIAEREATRRQADD
jgi:hypothetical protein